MGARSRSGKSSTKSSDSARSSTTSTKSKAKAAAPAAEETTRSLWSKVVDTAVELTPQETLTAAHWIRQATGVLLGTVFGILQLQGAPAILSFLLVSALTPPALLSLTNELDHEEISKTGTVQTEGMMPAIALFLLTWILAYTVFLPPST